MKLAFTLCSFTILILIGPVKAEARCTPGVTKCLSQVIAENAAASRRDAERLRETISKLGVETILSNCQSGADTVVTETTGLMCGAGTVKRRLCDYSTTLSCSYEGKVFEMQVSGACGGGLHDCGTFEACARDTMFDRKPAGFRSASAPVPKSAPAGVAQ